MTDDEVTADLQMVARLGTLPEWAALWRFLDDHETRHWTRLARDFATKNEQPDYAALQWQRGFFAFARLMRRHPDDALRNLEQILASREEE